jgi:hypothetical protein
MARPLPERPARPRALPPAQAAPEVTRRTPPNRPDPRPMRVLYGASSVAALTALTAGLVHPSPPPDALVNFDTSQAALPAPAAAPAIEVRHVINYVQLLPGQIAPPGATVITPDAPAPRMVITTVPAPPVAVQQQPPAQPKRRVRTRQSGTP